MAVARGPGSRGDPRVSVLQPSVVEPGESFTLGGSQRGSMEEPVEREDAGVRALPRRPAPLDVPAGSSALHTLDGVRLEEPGVHRFEVRTADGGSRRWQSALGGEAGAAPRVLWGDTHGHSGFAEGQGSPDGYYRFGRDVARLDFLSLSEHDMWMDDREWMSLIEAVGRYREPGRFTPLLGYEWTAFPQLGGHHNVYFADDARGAAARSDAGGARARGAVERAASTPTTSTTCWSFRTPTRRPIGGAATASWSEWSRSRRAMAPSSSSVGSISRTGSRWGSSDPATTTTVIPATPVSAANNSVGSLPCSRRRTPTEAIFTGVARAVDLCDDRRAHPARCDVERSPDGAASPRRTDADARGRVSGTQPIEFVDVVKNGEVVFRKTAERPPRDRRRGRWLQIWFESSTEVFNGHRNPRGAEAMARKSRRSRVPASLAWTDPWFAHPESYRVARPEPAAKRLEFQFLDPRAGNGAAARARRCVGRDPSRVHLEEGEEVPADPGARDRSAAELPSEQTRASHWAS